MNKKILSIILCVICVFSIFSACGKTEEENLVDLPIAEANPDITNPVGRFYEANGKPYAEGGLSALGDDFLRIMVDGTEYEFKMSDEVKRKIGIFNKDENDLKIKRGTMLGLEYEIEDGKYYAEDIEIINAN